jgi:hypothetical protein
MAPSNSQGVLPLLSALRLTLQGQDFASGLPLR